jgi:hypothetical protein
MNVAELLRADQAPACQQAPSHSACLAAYGVAFQLASNDNEVFTYMLGTVPFGTEIARTHHKEDLIVSLDRTLGGASYRLCFGDDAPIGSDELQPLLDRLRIQLMVLVADHAKNRVFVHAGVVGWQGRALIFPGHSFAGKSTLIAALVRAGATYYSDEFAVLDEQGSVHPYARDLQMRQPGGTEQTDVPVASLTSKIGGGPLPVAHVIFASYVPQARWEPQPLTAGAAVLEMLRHTIPVQRTPARVMSTLATMMQTATAVQSQRGEAQETAESILSSNSLQ